MSRALKEAALTAKSAHDAKLASGAAMLAARARLLASVLAAALPGLDAIASALRLFDTELLAVQLATRLCAREPRLREVLFAVAPTSAASGEPTPLLVVTYEEGRSGPDDGPLGHLRSWRVCAGEEAVRLFGAEETRWVERVSSELLHRLKRAGEGNNLRRAKEWTEKAARLEAIALLLEHESRSAK